MFDARVWYCDVRRRSLYVPFFMITPEFSPGIVDPHSRQISVFKLIALADVTHPVSRINILNGCQRRVFILHVK